MSDVARDLDVLFLIVAHRHKIGLIEQNVRRHQRGIGEQAHVDVFRVLLRLVFELRHARQLAHIGEAVEHPSEFRVRGHMGLEIDQALVRIQARGQVQAHQLQAVLPQLRGILPHGDRVQIHDGIQAIVFFLQRAKIAQRADVIAQMQVARGLNARKYDLFAFVFLHGEIASFYPSIRLSRPLLRISPPQRRGIRYTLALFCQTPWIPKVPACAPA